MDEDDALHAPTWYADGDGDGYGDAASSIRACTQPTGCTADDSDCDDGDGAVSPGALEICNLIDDDCDGEDDESDAADALTWYLDSDGDGFGDSAYSLVQCALPSGWVLDEHHAPRLARQVREPGEETGRLPHDPNVAFWAGPSHGAFELEEAARPSAPAEDLHRHLDERRCQLWQTPPMAPCPGRTFCGGCSVPGDFLVPNVDRGAAGRPEPGISLDWHAPARWRPGGLPAPYPLPSPGQAAGRRAQRASASLEPSPGSGRGGAPDHGLSAIT